MQENNPKLEVRKSIAAADETSIDLLQQLSEDPDLEVRRIVASNPNTPTEILLKLGEEFPETITANPIFNLLLLENPQSYFIRLSLARSSTTSDRMLAKLADTREPEDEEICCAVAKNPNTPIDVLEQLANWFPDEEFADYDSGRDVRIAVVFNPKTPVSLLEKIAYEERDIQVREAVAKNTKTPIFLLEYLAGEDDELLHQVVLENPNVSNTAIEIIDFIEEKPKTPIHILEKLATDKRFHIRRLILDYPHTPEYILTKIAQDLDRDRNIEFEDFIKHPNTSTKLLDQLTHQLVKKSHPEHYVKTIIKLIEHPQISANALSEIADLEIYEIMESIARLKMAPLPILKKLVDYGKKNKNGFDLLEIITANFDVPDEILEAIFQLIPPDPDLIQDSNVLLNCLAIIARNPNTPQYILEKMLLPDYYELYCVYYFTSSIAANLNTPVRILRELANYLDEGVVYAVAANKNTPRDILMGFVRNPNYAIRKCLASNQNASCQILKTLANDENEKVRASVAENISTPIKLLNRLANDRSPLVRESVTKNPRTPVKLLKHLANTWRQNIRLNVAIHPNTSAETLVKLSDDPYLYQTILDRTDLSEVALEQMFIKSLNKINKTGDLDCSERFFICKIAEHLNISESLLEKLFFDIENEINQNFNFFCLELKRAIIYNINTPIYLLERMTNDCDISLKEAAKKRLKAKIKLIGDSCDRPSFYYQD